MSREIKFRAWFKAQKTMFVPDAVWLEHQDISIGGIFYSTSKDMILMQYTGLKDKNGKEIYEGDLVKCNTPYGKDPKEVVWDKERAGFFLKTDFVAYDSKNLYKMSLKKMEIIGNIYENPELLDL